MKIIGNFIVYRNRNTIRNMKTGDSGFVFLDRAFLSKKYFTIHLDTEVFLSKEEIFELSKNGLFPFIKITKKGRKNTADSFEIDLTVCENIDQFNFNDIDNYHMKKKIEDVYNYLSFKKPPIIYYIEEYDSLEAEEETIIKGLYNEKEYFENIFLDSLDNLDILKKELSNAIEDENYLLAAQLRDKIKKIKNKSG
jgi:hypothetical protein